MNLATSLELKRASGFNMSSDAVNFLNAIGVSYLSVFWPLFRDPNVSPGTPGILRISIGAPHVHAGLLRSVLRYFPLFVPYFDRPRLRPSTPRASSVPRTIW